MPAHVRRGASAPSTARFPAGDGSTGARAFPREAESRAADNLVPRGRSNRSLDQKQDPNAALTVESWAPDDRHPSAQRSRGVLRHRPNLIYSELRHRNFAAIGCRSFCIRPCCLPHRVVLWRNSCHDVLLGTQGPKPSNTVRSKNIRLAGEPADRAERLAGKPANAPTTTRLYVAGKSSIRHQVESGKPKAMTRRDNGASTKTCRAMA